MHSKPMEIFFLNSKDIYKMTKKMLENCMFWDAWHCTNYLLRKHHRLERFSYAPYSWILYLTLQGLPPPHGPTSILFLNDLDRHFHSFPLVKHHSSVGSLSRAIFSVEIRRAAPSKLKLRSECKFAFKEGRGPGVTFWLFTNVQLNIIYSSIINCHHFFSETVSNN